MVETQHFDYLLLSRMNKHVHSFKDCDSTIFNMRDVNVKEKKSSSV